MQHIDEQRLETDLEYRFGFLAEFIGFGEQDIHAVHGAAEHLAPLSPIDDIRSGASYRLEAVEELLRRALTDCCEEVSA